MPRKATRRVWGGMHGATAPRWVLAVGSRSASTRHDASSQAARELIGGDTHCNSPSGSKTQWKMLGQSRLDINGAPARLERATFWLRRRVTTVSAVREASVIAKETGNRAVQYS